MNDRQKRFVDEYLVDFNATQAAIRAGYSAKTAYAIGSENLRKPEIAERIQYMQANLAETAELSALQILNEHRKIAFADIGATHDGWMSLKDFEALTPEQRAIIQEISTTTSKYGTDVKVKLYDKQKALNDISDMLGFKSPQKRQIEVNGNISSGSPLDNIRTKLNIDKDAGADE